MPSKIQLTGGAFQDTEGNLLANGYLTFELNQDSSVTGVGNICSGVEIRVILDANGDVQASPAQMIWGNDNLLPINSYYRVTAYSALGQPVWGPNNQQVVGSGTFDVGTWVPNQIFSWSPPVSAPLLKTNGTQNAVQSILDLFEGDNVTITDNGDGTVSIASAGGVTVLLQTNSHTNNSQTKLNLKSGDNITVTDEGSGNISFAASGFTPINLWHGWVACGLKDPALMGPYGCAPLINGTTGRTAATDTEPAYVKVTTVSTSNSLASIIDNGGGAIDANPECFPITLGILTQTLYRIKMVSLADLRVWVGFSDADGGGGTLDSPNPSQNLVAFRYSTFDGDTTWQAVCQTGTGNQTIVDTGITPDASVGHIFRIFPNSDASQISFSIDGETVADIATNIPLTTVNMRNCVTIDNFSLSASGVVTIASAYTYWQNKV